MFSAPSGLSINPNTGVIDLSSSLSGTYTVSYTVPTDIIQLGQDIDGEAEGDLSGSVSINDAGDRVAIGAHGNDGNGSNSGHVRIYAWNGTSWTQQGQDIDGEAAYDLYGSSVSMSAAGDRIAIGAHGNDGNGSNSGHVRIYEWSGVSWTQLGIDIDGEAAGDYSGLLYL